MLDVRHAINQSTQTLEFVATLHSTEGTHVDAPHLTCRAAGGSVLCRGAAGAAAGADAAARRR